MNTTSAHARKTTQALTNYLCKEGIYIDERQAEQLAMAIDAENESVIQTLKMARNVIGPHFIRSCGVCDSCGKNTPNGTMKTCHRCAIERIDSVLVENKKDGDEADS